MADILDPVFLGGHGTVCIVISRGLDTDPGEHFPPDPVQLHPDRIKVRLQNPPAPAPTEIN